MLCVFLEWPTCVLFSCVLLGLSLSLSHWLLFHYVSMTTVCFQSSSPSHYGIWLYGLSVNILLPYCYSSIFSLFIHISTIPFTLLFICGGYSWIRLYSECITCWLVRSYVKFTVCGGAIRGLRKHILSECWIVVMPAIHYNILLLSISRWHLAWLLVVSQTDYKWDLHFCPGFYCLWLV